MRSFVAFCSDMPLIVSRAFLGLYHSQYCQSHKRNHVRVCYTLNCIVSTFYHELNVTRSKTSKALFCDCQPFVSPRSGSSSGPRTSRAASGMGAPGPPIPPSSWPDCDWVSSALMVSEQRR